MIHLVDNIMNELEDAGIELLVEGGDDYDYHQIYLQASKTKIREAIAKAVANSIMEDNDENT
jgi:hypothetical protein